MIKDCTLFLSTYDAGNDLWEGFFKCLVTQWPELNMLIVMSTETKLYQYEGLNIQVINHNCKQWSKRLIKSLKEVKTTNILFFLEDYWLESKVDNQRFEEIYKIFTENNDISNICFDPVLPGTNIKDNFLNGFELRPKESRYKVNYQVALWKKEDLISFLRKHETPWESEYYASIRSFSSNKRFYSICDNTERIFNYHDGGVIRRGRWIKEPAQRIANLQGLNIDYSKRGFYDEINKRRNSKRFKLVRKIKRKIREKISLM